jgi:ABC-type Na+ efflux pump permease subunit
VLAAGVLILVFASTMLTAQLNLSQLGAALFSVVNQAFLVALWILVPLMTADCVSREKREGTLGLLFLTPLTVLDVIAGKAAIHVLRALTLFVAALPVLGLPLVLGGVDWRWVLMAAVDQANTVLLGIAAGVYASTRGGTTIQVMVLAEAWAWGFAAVSAVLSFLLWHVLAVAPMGLAVYMAVRVFWSLLISGWFLWASVHRLRATWQDEAAAPEQPRWVKFFSTSDFWQSFFRWDKSRTLDRNPMAWLQEYSWTARLTKWGWFLLVLLAEFILSTSDDSSRSPLWQPAVALALGLGVAFGAVGSFRREQETGLLELLLVTPISVRQFLGGRVWGLCCHYLPAVAALWAGWAGDRLLNPKLFHGDFIAAMAPNPLAFISLMMVGLYLSLGRLNFFLAWFLTWIVGFALPILGRIGLVRLAGAEPSVAVWFPLTFQLGLAVLMWLLLLARVRQREFLVAKGDRPLRV